MTTDTLIKYEETIAEYLKESESNLDIKDSIKAVIALARYHAGGRVDNLRFAEILREHADEFEDPARN